jgi:hypothetical protein
VATRDIRTSTAVTTCDVCGRTLLRGERAQIYLDGPSRRSVCELCTSRAVSEGWVREGTVPPYSGRDGGADRRRSLFGRLRRRREQKPEPAAEELDLPPEELEERSRTEPLRRAGERIKEETPRGRGRERKVRETAREPRHVRAVPTSVEQKIVSAIEVFNTSEHQRTVAGVARSLGPPAVSVRPVEARPSMVNVVVSWELCWYRYSIDLSDDVPGVRVDAQGYELDELAAEEQQPNAACDEHGALSIRT